MIHMLKDKIIEKMIVFYKGNISDINHFLKVHAFAALIGRMEGLDENTQNTLEIAAIVHDIACPLCREKYGNTNGQHQEDESEALLRPFLAEFKLPRDTAERVIFLVTHHHTYTDVVGADYQILLEADFLVNAGETEKYTRAIGEFRKNVFKTSAGRRLLDEIYSADT